MSYTEKISHKNKRIKEVRIKSRETKGIMRNKQEMKEWTKGVDSNIRESKNESSSRK